MYDLRHGSGPDWVRRWRRRGWVAPAAGVPDAGLQPMTVLTGASQGIGRALADEFAAAGHALLLVARTPEPLEAAAREVAARHRVEVLTLALDLTAADAPERIAARLAEAKAFADILVNNAGIGLSGPFVGQSAEEIARLADLNMRAPALLTRRFLPGMLARGAGGVLNVASLGGLVPGPHQAAYYASKAFVVSLTEAVAEEVKGQGVRVCALLPGPIATKFHARMGAEHSYYLTLLPVVSAERAARAGFRGFASGRRLIYSDWVAWLNAGALRLVPHEVLIPLMAWLLNQRR